MIRKLLIANRGEIACRIIKTARELGVATVAVYSDADADALHVQLADEAVRLGPAPAKESYLDIHKVIAAAQQTGADAVHPGYGFLSENAAFCRACDAAGVVFVGPPVGAIESMGSKSAAKRIMEEAKVPLVPGYHGNNQDAQILEGHAQRIGYPVLLKAAAGGGGKGMRRVDHADDFHSALEAAKREAQNAFGDDLMLLERYVVEPRHVEIQVFCDSQGNGVYLFERDCSVQRRHQKVVEEAPAPGMSEELRAEMGEAALRAAHAIGYVGAGTVEFLLDASGAFYFMEMNTRLQVEHPVTEMITGQDLVAWQLAVAAGEPLPLQQDDLSISGHALEVRIYAEDPDNDFLPATGTLVRHRPPRADGKESESVRVDTGVQSGDEISVYYDPMIAKLICYGRTRREALAKLDRALQQYQIAGVRHNIEFLRRVINHKAFVGGGVSTHFIEDYEAEILQREQELTPLKCAAIAGYLSEREARDLRAAAPAADPGSPWHSGDNWRSGLTAQRRHNIEYRGQHVDVTFAVDGDCAQWHSGDMRGEIRVLRDRELALVDGRRVSFSCVDTAQGGAVFIDGTQVEFSVLPPDVGEAGDQAHGLEAPMNGTIVALLVETGTTVEKDQPLLVMEAMKMEHTLRAPAAGTVQQFFCAAGELVDGGSLLIDFAEA